MSTLTTENFPDTFSKPLEVTEANVQRPWQWLLIILAVGLGMRLWTLFAPLQLDEFPTLYAVSERPQTPAGYIPSPEDTIQPVRSWQEVQSRSVMPFGIRQAVPLYNYLLYAVIQGLPITEWSLRLPALLAGLGCIVALYFLCRSMLGTEVALVAALFAAVDPIQITTSDLIQPYALANLACIASFAALLAILHGRRPLILVVAICGYALSMALIGYLNPILLFVFVAHAAMAGYWLVSGSDQRGNDLLRIGGWLAATAVAAALLRPDFSYFQQIWNLAHEHREYLFALMPIRLTTIFWHNSGFILGLLAIIVATAIVRWQFDDGEAAAPSATAEDPVTATGNVEASPEPRSTPANVKRATKKATESPPVPDNPEIVWMGRFWLFLPQLMIMMVAYTTIQSIFLTRDLSYTTLGGVIVLAYFATREPSREVRWGVASIVALVLALWSFWPNYSAGVGLISNAHAKDLVEQLDALEHNDHWQSSDMVLLRSSYPESDFLNQDIPEENRGHVERILTAPLTTFYTNRTRKPIFGLTHSFYRSEQAKTSAGQLCRPKDYYTSRQLDKLRGHQRFWITGLNPTPYGSSGNLFQNKDYLLAFLPWMATTLDRDLWIARNRKDAEHYLLVPTEIGGTDYVNGLSDMHTGDFTSPFHLIRLLPPGLGTLGVLGAPLLPNSQFAVPIWILSQQRTPRFTHSPRTTSSLAESIIKDS